MAGRYKKIIPYFVCTTLLFLTGCGKQTAQTTTREMQYEAEASAISYCVNLEQDGHLVQIPEFVSEHESAVLEEINQEIADTIGVFYEEDKTQTEVCFEAVTDVYETSEYLQVVVRYVEYPLVGGYGDVISYNYDRIQDKRLTLTDALVENQTTLDDVRQMVIDVCLKQLAEKEITIYGATVDGFSMDENHNCKFYGNVDLCDETQAHWSYIYCFDYETQTVSIYNLEENL